MARCAASCLKRVTNLGPEAQDRALRRGVILFAVSLALAVLLAKLGVGAPVRLALVVPLFMAANGTYMGLFKA